MEDKLRLPLIVDIHNLKRTAVSTKHTHYFSIDEGSSTSGVHLGDGTEHSIQTTPSSSPRQPEPRRSRSSLGDLLFGTGVLAVKSTCLAPPYRVQLLLQTQNEQIRSGRLSYPYKGIKDCLFRTTKHEGFLSLWRGNMTHAVLLFQDRAVKMGLLSCFPSNANPKRNEHGPRNVFAKSIALTTACIIWSIPHLLTYPLRFGMTRLACDVKQAHGSWQFTTLIDTYQKMLKSNGIAGLYRGYSMALCTDLVAVSIATSLTKTVFPARNDRQTAVHVNAPMIFMTTYVVFYPFDTVCRRMMMTTGEKARYSGAVDAFRQIAKREGLLSFYKGLGTSLLRYSVSFFLFTSMIKIVSPGLSMRN